MRTALVSFESELDRLLDFLEGAEAEDEVLGEISNDAEIVEASVGANLKMVQKNRTVKRRQGYVSSIVVLYGALERYVEEVVAEYADSLMQIYPDYDALRKELRERHTRLSIEYLGLLKDGRVRETEDMAQIVETLNGCLNEPGWKRLNARAFSIRSTNTSWGRIREIMRNLDVRIDETRVLAMHGYAEHTSVNDAETDEREVRPSLEHVDELVRLRNDIAHGVADLSEIEGPEIVRERVEKLRAFAVALNEILRCELMSARIALDQLIKIEGDVEIFGNKVVCFPWPSEKIAVGDVLVMKPADENADLRHGRIGSIEIDNVEHTEVEGTDGLMIGVKVQFKAKSNGTFYVLQGSD